MLGAIVGDVIGSIYEGSPIKTVDFPLFSEFCFYTDDTVMTVAVADALMHDPDYYLDRHDLYVDKLQEWFCLYPDEAYGELFFDWADERRRGPYNSWGNGSAMRVSPIAYSFSTLSDVIEEAKISAEVTHSHPEGIKGAQAVTAAVFLAKTGASKAEIKRYIESEFGYEVSEPLDQIRERYAFDVSCQGSVPQCITAFLESSSFEEAVRLAISLGGDADTMACITGSIAEPFYGGVPTEIAERALSYLDPPLRDMLQRFQERKGAASV